MREMAAMTPGGTRVLAVGAPVCDAAVALDNHQNQNIFCASIHSIRRFQDASVRPVDVTPTVIIYRLKQQNHSTPARASSAAAYLPSFLSLPIRSHR